MDSNHVTNCHSPKSRGGPGLESPTHTPPTAYIWWQRWDIISQNYSSVQINTRKDLCQNSKRRTDFRITDSRTTDPWETIWFTKLRNDIYCCVLTEIFWVIQYMSFYSIISVIRHDKIQCMILATKWSNRIICRILGKSSHKLFNGQNKLYAKSSNEFKGLWIHKMYFQFIKFHLIQISSRKVKTIS